MDVGVDKSGDKAAGVQEDCVDKVAGVQEDCVDKAAGVQEDSVGKASGVQEDAGVQEGVGVQEGAAEENAGDNAGVEEDACDVAADQEDVEEVTQKQDVEKHEDVVEALLAVGSTAIEGDVMLVVHSINIIVVLSFISITKDNSVYVSIWSRPGNNYVRPGKGLC